jgi:hypothetical protein
MDPKWEYYSFIDYFQGLPIYSATSGIDFSKTVFPAGSLMEDYYQACVLQGSGTSNFTLFYQIIEKRKAQLPQDMCPQQPNTLHMHLCGLVIQWTVPSIPFKNSCFNNATTTMETMLREDIMIYAALLE